MSDLEQLREDLDETQPTLSVCGYTDKDGTVYRLTMSFEAEQLPQVERILAVLEKLCT